MKSEKLNKDRLNRKVCYLDVVHESELEDHMRVYGVSMMSVVTLANLMC